MKKYLTFSYDDGTVQDRKLTQIFEAYGIKATFNLNSGSFGTKQRINHFDFDVCFDKVDSQEVCELYSPKRGFEVAVHGVSHKIWPRLDENEFAGDVAQDKEALEKLWGHNIIGAAYPCGNYDSTMAEKLSRYGIKYCRAIADTHTFSLPDNFHIWQPTCHDNSEDVFELADKFINYDGQQDALFYIWGHSFELDKNDRDRWANIEKLCKMLSCKKDIIYATNAEVYNSLTNK